VVGGAAVAQPRGEEVEGGNGLTLARAELRLCRPMCAVCCQGVGGEPSQEQFVAPGVAKQA